MQAPDGTRALTVLIVDDEPVNRMVLARMVEHLGSQCVEAASGPEALELLSHEAVDLVLMDIQMPQMSGIQAVERLRAGAGPNQQAPVVAVTGDTTRSKRDYLQLGFDDYANKPISLASVQQMLGARRQDAGLDTRRSAFG
ncbi:response regulator [Phenylobacterium sp. LjRoot225]|uniref:response regulator n=1 Tax=Phenylobacterium sp. LjRoot225 TaxID=3342285 RepID=UPI003ECD5B55